MAQAAAPLALTPEQRRILEAWRDAPQTPRQVAFRARLILLASAGVSSRGVARALRTTLVTVLFWRRRFHEGGLTRPDRHRSRPRPQATDHRPQDPADRPSHAPHSTSRGPALDYPEPGAS